MKCKGRRNPDHEKSTGNCGSDPAGRRSERYCRGRMPTAEIRPLRNCAGPVTGAMPSGSPDGEPRRDRTTGMDKDWGNPDGRRHGRPPGGRESPDSAPSHADALPENQQNEKWTVVSRLQRKAGQIPESPPPTKCPGRVLGKELI